MSSELLDHITSKELEDLSIRTQYSADAMLQVEDILNNGVSDQAVSRKNVEGITIDGAESLDLDDAIWAEKTIHGYCLWVHISDVSEVIPMYSPLDLEAIKRTTSIYRKNDILNMFPPELSNHIMSLNPDGGAKLTVSLQIDLDEECNVLNYSFYESSFTNLKRYDYEKFGEDFSNPESEYFSTLRLLKEVSDKLRIQRIRKGGLLNLYGENRGVDLGQNSHQVNDKTLFSGMSHDIIESIMVLENVIGGQHLVDFGFPSLNKRHDILGERSNYDTAQNSFHAGLQMHNYAHFTSPIRRYPDLFNHRSLKALKRGENPPQTIGEGRKIATRTNNMRTVIEAVGSQLDDDTKWENFLRSMEERLGRPVEVYDLKIYIKNATDRGHKLPIIIKNTVIELINQGEPAFWIWAAGVILLGKDDDLKVLMKKKILGDYMFSPKCFLNILMQTRILPGEGTVFELNTHEEAKSYSMALKYQGSVIATSKGTMNVHWEYTDLESSCRKKLIENVFNHFIENGES